MKVLAFDTSSIATSVAICEDGKLLGEVLLNTSLNHSVTLMPTIDFLMTQVGLKASDLDRIAVAQGPGSYTGLRIAVTAAKTLAWTLKIDLVGLSSLQAIAARVKSEALVIPLMNARRGMVYAAVYEADKQVVEDQHIALALLLENLAQSYSDSEELVFTGEAEMFKDEILATFLGAKILDEAPENLPSAFEIARLSENLEPTTSVHDFNPIYLKKVEAEEKWEAASGLVADDKDLVSRV
ncbi:MAG: tRNA (adenosine(37)-N6)-threonylcarbamoyltransferase complex dimerization subunit type 1 TsaB [Streptococcaceae bacterium]|jgi:tRNA threonylcarbamoyl adenosine modification protein YeaZ|nr:tRNA (adenosine(37)-N6)-threonylcarbamoyltransferase complex dimerization subunit type 1 TsaB [Streptococcaceae bacterium]